MGGGCGGRAKGRGVTALFWPDINLNVSGGVKAANNTLMEDEGGMEHDGFILYIYNMH